MECSLKPFNLDFDTINRVVTESMILKSMECQCNLKTN